MRSCCHLLTLFVSLCVDLIPATLTADSDIADPKEVYVLPIRSDINPPMSYLVRRGVKEAMEAKADLLILDMETNGGRVDVTEEIIQILGKFQGQTVTYVNRKAFSAGAFISVATQKIYMAPQSVIGAAAPILMIPGAGVQEMPETLEAKITSGIKALVRANAEKNGHNVEVVEAMIDRNKELKIDGKVLNEKGQILTLNNVEAAMEYGMPPKPLLSAGTVSDLGTLIDTLGFSRATRVDIKPTGAEKMATWLNTISPLLLMLGIACIYLEFKTPGFGLPGIVGITAFALYFLGSYVAGLAGLEWAVIFFFGLILVLLEFFVFPGTIFIALAGSVLMLAAVIMGMIDLYPGKPSLPSAEALERPVRDLLITLFGSALIIWGLSRLLPKTRLYSVLVSASASGAATNRRQEKERLVQIGQIGRTLSVLRPGGKAQFGEKILDVISQGELIDKGRAVKIIGHSGTEAIVEQVQERPAPPW